MNLTTKLDLNQTAFFLYDNKPMSLPVGRIDVSAITDSDGVPFANQTIQYGFRSLPYPNLPANTTGNVMVWIKLTERDVFTSFEELCEFLKIMLDEKL